MYKITQVWSDENGDLFRTGISRNGRAFIESITPAWEPGAGSVNREYVSQSEVDDFDPDPLGELNYKNYLEI